MKSSSLIPQPFPDQTLPSITYPGMLLPVDRAAANWRSDQTGYGAPLAPMADVPPFKSGASFIALLLRLLTYLLVMPLLILLTPLLLLYYYCIRILRNIKGQVLDAGQRPGLMATVLSPLPLPQGFWPAKLLIGEQAPPSPQGSWIYDPYRSPAVDMTLPPPTLAPIQRERRSEPSVAPQAKGWWRRVAYALMKGPYSLPIKVQSVPPLYQYDPYRQQQARTQATVYPPPSIPSFLQGRPPMGATDSGADGGTSISGRKNFCVLYHDNDRNWAEWIAWLLEEDGLSSIVPDWDFRAGYNVDKETRKAINEAQRVIVIISPDYLDARNIQWGIVFNREMMSREGMILPVIVKECGALRKPLDKLVPINLVGRDVFYTSHKLRKAVRLMRSKPTKPPAFPLTAHLDQEKEASTTSEPQFTRRLEPDDDQQQSVSTGASTSTAFTDATAPTVAKTIRFSTSRGTRPSRSPRLPRRLRVPSTGKTGRTSFASRNFSPCNCRLLIFPGRSTAC